MIRSPRCLTLAAVLVALAACSKGEKNEGEASKAVEAAPAGREGPQWTASENAPHVSVATGLDGQAEIKLARDETARWVFDRRVAGGETLFAQVRLSAPVDTPIRLTLIRECDSARGEDFEQVEAILRPDPIEVKVSHRFAQPYGCVRLDLTTMAESATVTAAAPTLQD